MSKIKLLKGLASLFKKKGPKKTEMFGPPRDPEVDYETAAALKKSRKRYDLERQNLSPLTKHLDDMMEESNKKLESTTNELKIQLSELEEMTKQMDEFNRIADEEGVDEALEQLNRILNPKRTLNADGGRIGKFKGGLMQLLKRVNPALEREMVKTGPFQTGHRGDVVGDMEQIKSLIRNEITDLEEIGKLEDMISESPRYGDKMKSAFMKLIDYEKFRANTIYDNPKLARFIKDDPEGAEEFLQSMYKAGGSQSGFNEGGRVGMFKGGKLLGEGIEQAVRLIQSGKKPFGQKQTYKQKVKMVGLDDFQKAMKQEFDEELYLINKVKGPRGNPEAELFDLYEDIASGTRYSMLPQATRSKMLSEIDDSLKAMDVDGADYQNFRSYLFDEYKFPNETAFDDIRRGIDKGQIKTMKAEDLLDALDRASGENVIPFKPRTKKADGGITSAADIDYINEATLDAIRDKPMLSRSTRMSNINDALEDLEKYLPKLFEANQGGLTPPQKGPMSEGMGTLYRRK